MAAAARTIDAAEAGSIAADFMQQLSPGHTSAMKKAPARNGSAATDPQPYYIFNSSAGGYVIV